eukprot:m.1034362 g.1034362  ORF g.1034362 m.1034362 type:complete len:130 (+) comp24135_c0_seq27:1453-1842(+)
MTTFSSIKAKLSSVQLSNFETMENSSEILGTVVSKISVGGCREVQFDAFPDSKFKLARSCLKLVDVEDDDNDDEDDTNDNDSDDAEESNAAAATERRVIKLHSTPKVWLQQSLAQVQEFWRAPLIQQYP